MISSTANLPGLPAPFQSALRILGYQWHARGRGNLSRRNTEETKMSSTEISTGAALGASQTQGAALPARKRQRPLTAGQEALFFGVAFAVAVALQLVVVLKVADIISW